MAAADADFATLTVPGNDDDGVVAAATGDVAAELLGRTTAIEDSLFAQTIRVGTPVLLTEHRADSAVNNSVVSNADTITQGPVMIVALSAGANIRGAVTIGRNRGRLAFTRADLDMAESFGTHAAVALALAESRDRQISDARLEDHDRIAFDMHDHVIGELFAVGMGLQGMAAKARDPAQLDKLNRYVDNLDHVISTIRTTIFELQSGRHDPGGLHKRILGVAEAHTDQLGYRPQLHFSGPLDLAVDENLATDVLAVTREALSNCARHARASSVTVSVGVTHDMLTLEITDNGTGIGTPTRSSGLSNLLRRAENHGGTFTVTQPDNGGTQVTWSALCGPRAAPS